MKQITTVKLIYNHVYIAIYIYAIFVLKLIMYIYKISKYCN